MNFDDAYKQMREGAAIFRPHWRSIDYLFWARDMVWAKYKTGKVRPFIFFNIGCSDNDDWTVVIMPELPTLPPPVVRKAPAEKRKSFRNLCDRQAAMKARRAIKLPA